MTTARYRLIYGIVGELIDANTPADVITVHERLQSVGKVEEAGGLASLRVLAQTVACTDTDRRYAEIVHERAILRELVAAGHEIARNALNPEGKTIAILLDDAERAIFNIGEQAARSIPAPDAIESLVRQALDQVQYLADDPKDVTGLPTGFYDLDRLTVGLQAGDVVVLAGRPAMGKTAMAINIAEHVAVNERLPVLMFSMGTGALELTTQMLASMGRIDQNHMRIGQLTYEEWTSLVTVMEPLSAASLHIDASPGLTAGRMRSTARRLAHKWGKLGLVIVDDLQRMSESIADRTDRSTEVGKIMGNLKLLAKELQCPVIALSPLNGSVDTRTDKRPRLSDLYESDVIEQLADIILLIYCDDYYYGMDSREPGVAEIIIGKQRNGPTGAVKLTFSKTFVRFENLVSNPDFECRCPS